MDFPTSNSSSTLAINDMGHIYLLLILTYAIEHKAQLFLWSRGVISATDVFLFEYLLATLIDPFILNIQTIFRPDPNTFTKIPQLLDTRKPI